MAVSFVIPVYNKAAHLPQVCAALESQAGDFDREFIFVEDGSTDKSLTCLKDLTANWPHTRIIQQENQGSAIATNVGIFAARHPFIKFVDADDLLHARATEILLRALVADPRAVLAYADIQNFRLGDAVNLHAPLPDGAAAVIPDALNRWLRNTMFNPTQFMTRTALAQQVGGCDAQVRGSQEYGLVLRLARLGHFLHLPQTLAFYCVADDARHGAANGRQLQRVNRILQNFVADFPDLSPDLRHHAWRRAAGRAWKFARRERQKSFLDALFWQNLCSNFFVPRDLPAAIGHTLRAFD